MKLKVYSINDRYVFTVGNFSSLHHFPLYPNIQPSYKYAWEAYRDAHKLYEKVPIHAEILEKTAADDLAVSDISSTKEISAEQMILGHYSKIFDAMVSRTQSFKDETDKKIAYEEIKGIVGGLLKVKESLESDEDKEHIDKILGDFRELVKDKFPKLLAKDKVEMEKKENEPPEDPQEADASQMSPMPQGGQEGEAQLPMMPMAQVDAIMRYASNNLSDIRHEIMDEYATRVCRSIEKYHPDAICKIDYDTGMFNISSAKGPLLRVSVNNDLHLQDIDPDGDLASAFPIHSLEFYQKYWKPIVERVGHCLVKDLGIVICPSKSTLPDIPNNFPSSIRVIGWSVNDKEERPFEIRFEGTTPTWMFKKVDFVKSAKKVKPSKYTEEDFIRGQPRRVQCTDPNLQSIYGKIGEVQQVLPLHDHIEADIDFGRLVVRLTESQFELVDEIPPNT